MTGGVGLVIRKGIVDDYNANCPGLGVAQPPTCDEQVSSSRTWLTVSILTLIGGGVFAGGGGVLVVTAPSAKATSSAARPRFACAPSARGEGARIGCAGSF